MASFPWTKKLGVDPPVFFGSDDSMINGCPLNLVDKESVLELGKTVVRVTLNKDDQFLDVTAPGRAYLIEPTQ